MKVDRLDKVITLLALLAFAAGCSLDAFKAFSLGRAEWWLWGRLPFYLGFFGFMLVSALVWAWMMDVKDSQSNKGVRLGERIWYLVYIVLGIVAMSLSREFLPATGWTIYAALYWSLIGVTVIAMSGYVLLSACGTVHRRRIKQGLGLLLFLAGLASGPMVVLWYENRGLGLNSPASAIVGLFAAIPLYLYFFSDDKPVFKEGVPNFILR